MNVVLILIYRCPLVHYLHPLVEGVRILPHLRNFRQHSILKVSGEAGKVYLKVVCLVHEGRRRGITQLINGFLHHMYNHFIGYVQWTATCTTILTVCVHVFHNGFRQCHYHISHFTFCNLQCSINIVLVLGGVYILYMYSRTVLYCTLYICVSIKFNFILYL